LQIAKYLYLGSPLKLKVNCKYEDFYPEQTNLNVWKIDVFQLALEFKYVQPIYFWLKNLNLSRKLAQLKTRIM